MWKSRADKLPPAQFFADLLTHLRNLYPGAILDEKLVRALRDIWIAEWRAGQSAQDTAKATCSCDGTTIVPSAGAGRELGKRLARAPKGAKRGDFIAPDALREVTPLAAARREAERYAQAFDRLRSVTLKLLQVKGWSAAKALRLQKLRAMLGETKAKHEAAVATYESIRRSRREAKEPELYTKPLGAVGLTLRTDELPEPPPLKEQKPAKEKKPAKERKPRAEKTSRAAQPVIPAQPTAAATQATDPASPAKADCTCKHEARADQAAVSAAPAVAAPAATSTAELAAPAVFVMPASAASPSAERPKRTRKPKAAAAASEEPKAALSDAEAEELANLFAKASAEDTPS